MARRDIILTTMAAVEAFEIEVQDATAMTWEQVFIDDEFQRVQTVIDELLDLLNAALRRHDNDLAKRAGLKERDA